MNFLWVETQGGARSKRLLFAKIEKMLFAEYNHEENSGYLRCSTNSCKARGKIENGIFSRTNSEAHNHPDHAAEAEAKIAYAKLKLDVVLVHRDVRKLYNEATRKVRNYKN